MVKRPEPIGVVRFMTENVILENGTHRVKFKQQGQIPDLEEIKARFYPKDGSVSVTCVTWMDDRTNKGHVYLAWKETIFTAGKQMDLMKGD